jgi:hypothetical protein
MLAPSAYRALLADGAFEEIAGTAVRIESRTNLLFSFEKMALRDAIRTKAGARSLRRGAVRLPLGPRRRRDTLRSLVRRGREPAAPTDARAHLAARDGVRLHRASRHAHLPQTNVTRIAAEAYGPWTFSIDRSRTGRPIRAARLREAPSAATRETCGRRT